MMDIKEGEHPPTSEAEGISATELNGQDENSNDAETNTTNHTALFTKLIADGFSQLTAGELEKLVKEGKLQEEDLDDKVKEAIKGTDDSNITHMVNEISAADMSNVKNKSAYLCGLLKMTSIKLKLNESAQGPGPNPTKLKEILERTGYSHEVTPGMRKYGGPPPEWGDDAPGHGHELFLGHLPPDTYEDKLIPLMEKFGKLYEIRVMVDQASGENRGYSFCTFCNKDDASKAVKELVNHEISPGRRITVKMALNNQRLFVGNIPKQKTKEELLEEFQRLTTGCREVIVFHQIDDPTKNRGFCFADYETHNAAASAKRLLSKTRFFSLTVVTDWAEPLESPSEEEMAKVKTLFMKKLEEETTEEMLRTRFEPYGKITRIKKVKDYAFVEYDSREDALQALNDLNTQKCGDSVLDITMAKPQDKSQGRGGSRGSRGGRGRGYNDWGGFSSSRGSYAPRGGYTPRGSYGGHQGDYGGHGGDYGGHRGDYGGHRGDYGGHRGDYGAPRDSSKGRSYRGGSYGGFGGDYGSPSRGRGGYQGGWRGDRGSSRGGSRGYSPRSPYRGGSKRPSSGPDDGPHSKAQQWYQDSW